MPVSAAEAEAAAVVEKPAQEQAEREADGRRLPVHGSSGAKMSVVADGTSLTGRR